MPPFRIACLETDPDVRDILSLVLGDVGGFAYYSFEAFDDALFELPILEPDFILLDPTMEFGMSGVDFCYLLLNNPFLKNVPMAFLSSRVLPHEVEYLERLAPVILKPFDPMTLPGLIRSLHGAARKRRHNPSQNHGRSHRKVA